MHVAEIEPMLVRCDIHAWMKGHWLVVDHPYATITDKQGRFQIIGLPAGEHTFRIWHERFGYIDEEYKVTIADNKVVEMPPLSVPASTFDER